jgi:putative SOS response-associated peptidase YedK
MVPSWCGLGGDFRRAGRRGRRFPNGRCLIPASHLFEVTGSKSPKSKWKFTKPGEDWFCFAGL